MTPQHPSTSHAGPARRALRRPSSALAAVALVALSVFAGAGSAQAVPPSGEPTVDLGLSGTQIDTSFPPVFEIETADTETDVDVVVTGRVDYEPYCSASTFSGTTTTCSGVNLPPGDYTAVAIADLSTFADPTDGDETLQSAEFDFTVYSNDPVTFTTTAAPTSSDATPSYAGTGPALGEITVIDNGTNMCTSPIDVDGDWACTSIPRPLGMRTNLQVTFAASNLPGNNTQSGSVAGFEIVPPDDSTIDMTFGDPWHTTSRIPELEGTKDPQTRRVEVEFGPSATGPWTEYCSTTTGIGNTTWSCSEPDFLEYGVNYLRATAYNEFGSPADGAPQIQIVVVDEPTIVSPQNYAITNDTTPTWSGTADPNTTSVDIISSGLLFIETYCSTTVTGGTWTCTRDGDSPLGEGTRDYVVQANPGTQIESEVRTFTIDTSITTPTITGPGASNGSYLEYTTNDLTPTISGFSEEFAQIDLFAGGLPLTCEGGELFADSDGTWQCTPADDFGYDRTYSITARQTDLATNTSAVSATQLVIQTLPADVIVVPVPPTPDPEPTATPSATPTPEPTPTATEQPELAWSFSTGGITTVQPGDLVLLTSGGVPAGATVDAELHSTPVHLGTTTVGLDETFSLPVLIPLEVELGDHQFVVTMTTTDGRTSTVSVPVTIVAPDPITTERAASVGPEKTGGTDAPAGALGSERANPAAPSAFTHSLPTLAALLANPLVLGIAGAAGIGLLLLVAFPAELLNSTISEQYPRFAARLPKAPWLTRFRDWVQRTHLLGGIGLTLVAAVIFGFADPGFGFDVTSLRLVLACGIALFIVGYLASIISGRIIRARWGLSTMVELKPLGLVLTVVGVALSRILEFSPGFLLGLLLGIAVVGNTTVAQRAKAALVQAGVVFALAVLAWIGYSTVSAIGGPETFGSALVLDTLVAVTAEGLTALFVGLLPFRLLDGPAVFEWSKPIWAAVYAVAAFTFVALVVPNAWGEITGPIPLWLAVVGAFAIVALGIYAYFRFWAPPLEDDDGDGAVAERHPAGRSL